MVRPSKPLKKQLPTSTVNQIRLPLFTPATRGSVTKKTFETNWGTVVFHRGSLTQRHRDVFEAIVACHTRFERYEDAEGYERISVEFERSAVLKMLGTPHNHTWLKEMLIDMAGVVAELKTKKDGIEANLISGLIEAHKSTSGVALRRSGQFSGHDEDSLMRGGDTPLWKIVLSPQLVALYNTDINIHMNKLVPAILGLENAISRSVARWMLSHTEDQCHRINDIFDAVGAAEEPSNRRKLLSQLRDDAVELKKLGIDLGEGSLLKAAAHYKKNKRVCFYNPLKAA